METVWDSRSQPDGGVVRGRPEIWAIAGAIGPEEGRVRAEADLAPRPKPGPVAPPDVVDYFPHGVAVGGHDAGGVRVGECRAHVEAAVRVCLPMYG